jgi:predicted amidohydrolase
MKKIVIAAALVVSGLLVGCNQLTQYTVSEQEINQALEKHNNFPKTLACRGLPMRISSSAISPVRLGVKSQTKSPFPVMRPGYDLPLRQPESQHQAQAEGTAGFQ